MKGSWVTKLGALAAIGLPLSAFTGPAFALDNQPVTVGFVADGPQTCSYSLFDKTGNCEGVVYMHSASNHRTAFTFAAGDSTFTFSGAVSAQPSADLYVLTLDLVAIIHNAKSPTAPVNRPATGQCRVDATQDGQRINQLMCGATTELGNATLMFSGHQAAR
jgi:hypothetical protein